MKLIKKWWRWFVNFWKGIWAIVKSMGSWKGVVSLILVWLIISGSGVALVGFILQNAWLIGVGTSIYTFWLLPLTPMIPINIALAMVVQRFIFQDRNVSIKSIKEKFKEAFKKEEKENENGKEE
ncbi:hypothetical protein [Methanoculleus sp.]|uniref:hypothetical protein n=1 Tax=Methanoculleus sp. TaxID=90427 RepID=UPI0025E4BEA7|nr:hypothetical protein [Methanoculleus sp.]MCK9319548.1 hypothetical protein [Methanoculleus sp.]